jgi:MerR family mercuric resistance operon transcriptional regulator
MPPQQITIAGAAKAAGVGVETVRYYQRRGLLREPPRMGAGYRRYEAQHIDRLRFIKRAQALGFSLNEIETLLSLEDGTGRRNIQRIARARLTEIRARLADLRRLERTLTHLLRECEGEKTPHCPIIAAIAAE